MRKNAILASAVGLGVGFCAASAHAVPRYALTQLLSVPASPDNKVGGALIQFDNSFFDGTTQNYYLADRSNVSVDIFSAATNSFVGRIGGSGQVFTGLRPAPPAPANLAISGPNGIIIFDVNGRHELFAGDGNSTVKGFDLATNAPLPNSPISTGNAATDLRDNEFAYSPQSKRLLIVNSDASPAYATLIDATTNAVVSKTYFDGTNGAPNATQGLKASTYDPATNLFYTNLAQINGTGSGAVVAINPDTGQVVKVYDLATFGFAACAPVGIAKGNGSQLLLGCSAPSQSILLDTAANGGNGSAIGIPQVSGADQVWFDPASDLYFAAARYNPTGPVLGIIDGATSSFVQNLPATPNTHSVAVDPVSGEAFVPFAGIAGNTVCPQGCIAVFSPTVDVPEPASGLVMLTGLLALAGLTWRRWTGNVFGAR